MLVLRILRMWQFSEHDVVTEKSASVNRTNIPPMNFRYGFSLLQITGLRDHIYYYYYYYYYCCCCYLGQ